MNDPRYQIRVGNYPYKYVLEEDYSIRLESLASSKAREAVFESELQYECEWFTLTHGGLLTIKKGYAWDGCTPKKSLWNLWIVGVPDGHIDYRTQKPYTYYASLVHDALYQYGDTVPMKRKQIDGVFLELLGDFKLAKLYYWMVRIFGGRF